MTIEAWIVQESCCDGHYLMTVATEAEAKRVCEYESTSYHNLRYYQMRVLPFSNVDKWIEQQEENKKEYEARIAEETR